MPYPRMSVVIAAGLLAAVVLAGCSAEMSDADRAQARVTAAENDVADARAAFEEASDAFCRSAESYIEALDRYGDVLNDTAPTVGDVNAAGADLEAPRDDAYDSAQTAVDAMAELTTAEQALVDAQVELASAQAGPSGTPAATEPGTPSPSPLAPSSAVERVEQAETEFAEARSSVTDETPLSEASERFNSAAVALELAWLRLFADAGCLTEEAQAQAEAAVRTYTTALQQDLATAGYYTGAVDGVYGPMTVQAVEDLQKDSDLPITGTMDSATEEALRAQLASLGDAAAQDSVASTAAVQQTLALVGFWDGPIDGMWTPELTAALSAFQMELGVEPTGTVDAATIAAFERAITDLTQPAAPTPTPTSSGG